LKVLCCKNKRIISGWNFQNEKHNQGSENLPQVNKKGELFDTRHILVNPSCSKN